MHRICTPHGPLLQSFSESEVRPHQNILGVHRDLFLHEHAKMLLHCKLREEGLLSPHTGPFIQSIERGTENNKDVLHETKETKQNVQINNADIMQNIKATKNDQKDAENQREDAKEEWKACKNVAQMLQEKQKEECVENNNKYQILQEKEEDDKALDKTNVDDIQYKIENNNIKIKKASGNCDVNEITLDEIEEHMHLNETSGVKNNSSAEDESDDYSNAEEELVEDKDFEDDNLGNDSVSAEKVIMLCEKIESLQYQNEIDIQRSHTLELEAKKNRTKLHEKEEKIKTSEEKEMESFKKHKNYQEKFNNLQSVSFEEEKDFEAKINMLEEKSKRSNEALKAKGKQLVDQSNRDRGMCDEYGQETWKLRNCKEHAEEQKRKKVFGY